ncbi:hypothetical protein B0T10DRAFT_486534 [Thelonectria olida]|uniref:LITAF domain-containing protein n=1 Tax=Thelonectria olida TaxID=1576542 RepID=A0A9P8W6Q9_9HYPO|nr:hypothetical protein B0T10DRAFT_486534 [Thelonectria olida]
MSTLSPVSNSAEPSSSVSPPSYAATPVPPPTQPADKSDEGKIAFEKPIPGEGIEAVRPFDDDNLPEVVPEGHIFPGNNNNNNNNITITDKPNQDQYPPDSKTAMRTGADESQGVIPPGSPPPPGYSNGNSYQMMNMTPPVHQSTTNFAVHDQTTVTPLHLLGDQSDTVDCPFCQRRTLTLVKYGASWLTHFFAVCLFFLTFCGVLAPYLLHWNSNISHWCQNCNRKVAYRNFGSRKMVVLGTPDHLREVSKFQAAEPPVQTMNPNAAQQA